MPRQNNRPASVNRLSASRNSASLRLATGSISSYENSRPNTAPICATSLAAVPIRSSRAIRDACSVAGTAIAGSGLADSTASTRLSWPARSMTALVSSSTNSGTPSVRSTISPTTSLPSGALPASPWTSVSTSRSPSRLSASVATCG